MWRARGPLGWLLVVFGCLGCGNQVIIPPSRFALGTGVSTSDAGGGSDRERDPSAALDLRWTLHPLGFASSARDRRVDVGMGYGATWAGNDTYGPELLGAYYFWRGPDFRAGLIGSAQIAMGRVDQRRERGYGAALGLDFEHTGFVQDSRHAYGEWALGSYTTVRRVSIDGLVVDSVVFGFTARVPFTVSN
jgi:hypothetical protein